MPSLRRLSAMPEFRLLHSLSLRVADIFGFLTITSLVTTPLQWFNLISFISLYYTWQNPFKKKSPPFPQRSAPTPERQAPCGGLIGKPNLYLPKVQPNQVQLTNCLWGLQLQPKTSVLARNYKISIVFKRSLSSDLKFLFINLLIIITKLHPWWTDRAHYCSQQ